MFLIREPLNGTSVSVARVLVPPGIDVDVDRCTAEISLPELDAWHVCRRPSS
jgi:hypothetical protein